MTNREFAKSETFSKSCQEAEIEPTLRQASKFRRRRGLAYQWHRRRVLRAFVPKGGAR